MLVHEGKKSGYHINVVKEQPLRKKARKRIEGCNHKKKNQGRKKRIRRIRTKSQNRHPD